MTDSMDATVLAFEDDELARRALLLERDEHAKSEYSNRVVAFKKPIKRHFFLLKLKKLLKR